ncbi:MAG: DUF4245 domain-containing protein [Pseudonocardiaceae bacterium]|nr:DUF4245 domain-containing protein [Pseudonocardiaceae bacterium]
MAESEPSGGHPGRAALRMRDMVGAVLLLVVIIGGVLAFYGGCSFSPGGPSVDPRTAPSVDASDAFGKAASSVTFPVRHPAVPDDWRANSTSTAPVGTGATANVVVRVGWVTATGKYVQLSQSGARRADVVAKETGRENPKPTGEVEVAGVTWTSYPSHRDEPAWVTDLNGTTTLITGSAPKPELETLAKAVQKAPPLPH